VVKPKLRCMKPWRHTVYGDIRVNYRDHLDGGGRTSGMEASTWVVESSGLQSKTKTDGLIKTAESPGNDRTLVVTITKNPTAQPGTYEIDFIGKCTSIWSSIPSDAESRTGFANFVLRVN
jgi:hypothetical protein